MQGRAVIDLAPFRSLRAAEEVDVELLQMETLHGVMHGLVKRDMQTETPTVFRCTRRHAVPSSGWQMHRRGVSLHNVCTVPSIDKHLGTTGPVLHTDTSISLPRAPSETLEGTAGEAHVF
jgi:hypothetical protein